MPSQAELAGGEAQRVGPPTAQPSQIVHHVGKEKVIHQVEMPNHTVAFEQVMRLLMRDERLRPDSVGHRMVHGATRFADAAIVDKAVMSNLEEIKDMAPLHNPPAMILVYACQERYPDLPQVVVFDTAFHATIPDYARTYALPRKLSEGLGIRKYGFHGTSHQYVSEEAAKFLGKPHSRLNAVSCHIGSGGASLCAIIGGKSVDNTMGYSPLQGLVMSTRSGDLDPAVTLRLLAGAAGDSAAVEKLLNKRSGVLGMSGVSADIRDAFAGAANGSGQAPGLDVTSQVYLWRIRKYLGAYLAVVGQADAVIFTDTIGETVPIVRWAVCTDMEVFGLKISAERNNNVTSYPADVAADESEVRILVVQTNEELAIARRTYATLNGAVVAKGGAA